MQHSQRKGHVHLRSIDLQVLQQSIIRKALAQALALPCLALLTTNAAATVACRATA